MFDRIAFTISAGLERSSWKHRWNGSFVRNYNSFLALVLGCGCSPLYEILFVAFKWRKARCIDRKIHFDFSVEWRKRNFLFFYFLLSFFLFSFCTWHNLEKESHIVRIRLRELRILFQKNYQNSQNYSKMPEASIIFENFQQLNQHISQFVHSFGRYICSS